MPVRDVLLYPAPELKQVCAPASAGDELERVVTDLIDTMRSFPGCVGIAAPQIGELVRIAVIDVSQHKKAPELNHGLTVLVNPEVTAPEGAEVAREGCLSIPHLTANVRRATRVKIGNRGTSLEMEGFEARCALHEIDHLDGLLFLDRVDSLTNDVFARKRSAGEQPTQRGSEGAG